MQNRFVVLGPPSPSAPFKRPGIYSSMQFKAGGYSAPPLPLHIQCPDHPFAQLVYDKLQAWLGARANWSLAPVRLVTNFIASAQFREVAALVEDRGELIWAVKHGGKPGLYLDTAEAIATVDNSKSTNGRRFQEAFAFRSFSEAVKAQMLNDVPTTAFYTYNPAYDPVASAALRARLLDDVNDVRSETPDSAPDNNLDAASNPGNRQPSSPPSTPQRQASRGNTQLASSPYNVTFAPVVELRLNSSGPNSGSPTNPGLASPSRRGAHALRNRVALGRRFLEIEGLSSADILEVEGVLMGSRTSDAFIEAVGQAEDGSGLLTDVKALFVWDMYKML